MECRLPAFFLPVSAPCIHRLKATASVHIEEQNPKTGYKSISPISITISKTVDENNNVIPGIDLANYYYLVTRDTNLLVLTAHTNASSLGNKAAPFTVSASNQSANSTNTAISDRYISASSRK